MNLVGIDYGINSPALCKWDFNDINEEFNLKNCEYFTTCRNLKYNCEGHNFKYLDISNCIDTENRGMKSETIAAYFTSLLKFGTVAVGLEGYAMGAKGRVFDIAEHTALLKYYMMCVQPKIPFYIFAPGEMKKFAGKGNWDKVQMYDALCKKLQVDFASYLGLAEYNRVKRSGVRDLKSPLADFCDATWIVLFLKNKLKI
jgi:hypothetical protein